MPQQMGRAAARPRHARTPQRPRHDRGDGTRSVEGTNGSPTTNKHRIGRGPRSAVLHLGDDRLTHLVAQRQSRVPAALATHVNPGPPPVDVTHAKMRDVAGPKTPTGEQQQNGAIPSPDR